MPTFRITEDGNSRILEPGGDFRIVEAPTIREIAPPLISLGGGAAGYARRRRRLKAEVKFGFALGAIFTISAEILPGAARGIVRPKKITGEIKISGKASGAGIVNGEFLVFTICVLEAGTASGFDSVGYDNDFLLTAA